MTAVAMRDRIMARRKFVDGVDRRIYGEMLAFLDDLESGGEREPVIVMVGAEWTAQAVEAWMETRGAKLMPWQRGKMGLNGVTAHPDVVGADVP